MMEGYHDLFCTSTQYEQKRVVFSASTTVGVPQYSPAYSGSILKCRAGGRTVIRGLPSDRHKCLDLFPSPPTQGK